MGGLIVFLQKCHSSGAVLLVMQVFLSVSFVVELFKSLKLLKSFVV